MSKVVARQRYFAPLRSELWRTRELKPLDVESSPAPSVASQKGIELSGSDVPAVHEDTKVGSQVEFRTLTGFGEDHPTSVWKPCSDLPPGTTENTGDRIMDIDSAVELLKELGAWESMAGQVAEDTGSVRSGDDLGAESQDRVPTTRMEELEYQAVKELALENTRASTPGIRGFAEVPKGWKWPGAAGEGDKRQRRSQIKLPPGTADVFPRLMTQDRALPVRRMVFDEGPKVQQKVETIPHFGCNTAESTLKQWSPRTMKEVSDPRAGSLDGEQKNVHELVPWMRRPSVLCQSKSKRTGRLGSRRGPIEFPKLSQPAKEAKTMPQQNYFQRCEDRNILPHFPRIFLEQDLSNKASLNIENFGTRDEGLRALAESLPALKCHLRTANLAGNSLTGATVCWFFHTALKPHGSTLTELDLSYNRNIGETAISALSQMLLNDEFDCLSVLRLCGVDIPERCWEPMCRGLLRTGLLHTLAVGDTGLGRTGQGSCASVANLLCDGRLTDLDVSANFFRKEGCEALAQALGQTETLTSLDLSLNAGDYLPAAQGSHVGGDMSEHALSYQPILLICEGIMYNKTLKSLALSQCSLEYAGDFVLEDSLRVHPVLSNLNVSSNPHGRPGIRCLLRAVSDAQSRLALVNLAHFRDNDMLDNAVEYNYSNPSGAYSLDLAHPQHRAVLRMLLARVEANGDEQTLEDAFQFGEKSGNMRSIATKDSEGNWKVPKQGHLHFIFSMRSSSAVKKVVSMQQWKRMHKIGVNLQRFVTLLGVYKTCVADAQRVIFLQAAGSDLLLKTAHLKFFVKYSPVDLGAAVVQALFHAIDESDTTVLFSLLKNQEQAKKARTDAARFFFFNTKNPTGRYKLDLHNACDNGCAEHLRVINFFDREVWLSQKKPDISQHGNSEGVRNARYNQRDLYQVHGMKQFAEYVVPSHGILELDYVTLLKQSINSTPVPTAVFDRIVEVVISSTCSWVDQLQALRTITHLLILSAFQMKHILFLFQDAVREGKAQQSREENDEADAGTSDVSISVSEGMKSSNIRMRGNDAWRKARSNLRVSLLLARQKHRSAFGMDDEEHRRPAVELFVVLFARCFQPWGLVSSDVLYDTELFSSDDNFELKNRLGAVHVFDWFSCHLETTNLPRANRFVLDLSVNEERCVADYLVRVAAVEDGESILEAAWSGAEWAERRAAYFYVPATWLNGNLPRHGTFSCTYVAREPQAAERCHHSSLCLGWEQVSPQVLHTAFSQVHSQRA